ncbi:SRPBCC domain-containing protein [Pseudonocardia endophytica]|uniref:Uncharacterized protein YndB with AHSA1/START domain n=1 Tax=Pseudonocardia endophytica TaxID=401976 RepID=A0A4R1HQW7_PSEEN|nr:SRPBCC domain-containing protein [Pseudonocardia endophytica]TCK22890.1 uncharacterized protein YndB with AHSA1/START domain [Pseudonocardia endophytica]
MGFPDRIERTVRIGRAPEVVWDALTTAEGLASWFGDRAEIDLRPGGAARLMWTDVGKDAELRVERVEPPHLFAFTWPMDGVPSGDPRRSYVEFTLVADGEGTLLTVVETGFAQLDGAHHRTAYDGHVEGWGRELGELVDALAA